MPTAREWVHTASVVSGRPSGEIATHLRNAIGVFAAKKTNVTAAPVAFRFTPTGTDAHHQIDDVYVDPYGRG